MGMPNNRLIRAILDNKMKGDGTPTKLEHLAECLSIWEERGKTIVDGKLVELKKEE